MRCVCLGGPLHLEIQNVEPSKRHLRFVGPGPVDIAYELRRYIFGNPEAGELGHVLVLVGYNPTPDDECKVYRLFRRGEIDRG